MIGITGLVDTLLAAKLSQRLDQLSLSLKPDAELPAPQPPVPVQRAANDVRLPSRAALDGTVAGGRPAPAQPAVSPSDPQLSSAARVISAVLADPQGEAGAVRGTAPLSPTFQLPATGALAGALQQTLSTSGLFYESHLLQFAAGQRPLDQLAQEPHAHFAAPASTSRAAVGGGVRGGHAPAEGPTLHSREAQPFGAAADAAADLPAATVSSAQAVAQVVHPQAVGLVHQQLDLLATGVFRWSGEAWPGVAMEWSVSEEAPTDRDTDAPPGQVPARRWSTQMSLDLPRLGRVEVKLSLCGAAVQASLTAADAAVLARLREAGGGLSQRLESAGLRLDELKIVPQVQP
jgi:hypothetical protein